MKRFISIVLLFALITAFSGILCIDNVYADTDVEYELHTITIVKDTLEVRVNGKEAEIPEFSPMLTVSGEIMSGVRFASEITRSGVTYDHEFKTLTFELEDITAIFTIDSKDYTVNGEKYQLTVAPVVINETTYIPIYDVIKSLGFSVTDNTDENSYTFSRYFPYIPPYMEVRFENIEEDSADCYVDLYNIKSDCILIIATYTGVHMDDVIVITSPSSCEYFMLDGNFDKVKAFLIEDTANIKPLVVNVSRSMTPEDRILAICNSDDDFRGIYQALKSDIYEYPFRDEIQSLRNSEIRNIAGYMRNLYTCFDDISTFNEACKQAYKLFLAENDRPSSGGGSSGGGGGTPATP